MLIEMVMTVALLGLVMVTVYGGLWSMTDAVTGTERRLENLDQARVLMATTSKDLRTATTLQAGSAAFLLAADKEAVFYANLNNSGAGVTCKGPRKVRIYVDAQTQLVEEVTEPDAPCVGPNYTYTGTPSVRFVGRYVANVPAAPIFTYYDDEGNVLGPTPLSDVDRLKVRQVKITLAIRKETTYEVADTVLVNRVRLPNLDYQEVG